MTLRVEQFNSMSQLEPVLDDIRFSDMEEWTAGTGLLFGLAVAASLEDPVCGDRVSLVASDDVGPLVFWGGQRGQLWLFATNRAVPKAMEIHRLLRKQFRELESKWSMLTATAYYKNVKHHEWLRWLGFEELSETPEGPFGLPFKVFVKESSCAFKH